MAIRPSARVRLLPPESNQANDEQHRCNLGYVEGKQLHDQGGANMGAEHNGERGHEAHYPIGRQRGGHQAGRGAGLQQRGQTEAGAEPGEAIVQRLAEEAAQVGTERAQHPAEDHVQTPQQQGHAAHQIKQNDRAHLPQAPQCRFGIGLCARKQSAHVIPEAKGDNPKTGRHVRLWP